MYLLGPGPSMVHPKVYDAMTKPMIDHMSVECANMRAHISYYLRRTFQTDNDYTLAVAGTGTAGMEFCLNNFVSMNDLVVILDSGFFSERMKTYLSMQGIHAYTFLWQHNPSSEALEDFLRSLSYPPSILCIVHGETSTGYKLPIDYIIQLFREHCDPLVIVDAVTTLGGSELCVDDWGIDVCFSCSQKCLSCPPGLAPVTFNERASAKAYNNGQSFYLSHDLICKYWFDGVYHITFPINMLYALHEGLALLHNEGLHRSIQRHTDVGEYFTSRLLEMNVHCINSINNLEFAIPYLACLSNSSYKNILLQSGIHVGGGLGSPMTRIGFMGLGANYEYADLILQTISNHKAAQA